MNKNKLSNPVRLIAFFLTAAVLICTFGFTVDGWNINIFTDNNNNQAMFPDPPDNEDEGDSSAGTTPDEPEVYIPEFVDRITGLEVSEEIADKAHLAFVMNPNLPIYGISNAELLSEIPTEDGTRYLAFISDIDNLWKIGSLTPTRGYISNIAKYYGSVTVANGCDDSIQYGKCDTNGMALDLSNGSYHYTEFTSNVYTNRDLLSSGILTSGIDQSMISAPTLPYDFPDFGSEPIAFDGGSVIKITINRGRDSVSDLIYNSETGKYTLCKNGMAVTDSLNGKTASFDNCFVLSADSITYDNAESNQMVMDTIGQGKGYYFTGGSFTEISWVGCDDGTLTFFTTDGERLKANRGTTYISFIKSSKTDSILFDIEKTEDHTSVFFTF